MTMAAVFEMFSYPFVVRALVVGVLVSLCAALLGVVLVLKRYSMIGHALADVGFAALSIAMAVGVSPLYVSTPVLVVASFAIMAISQQKGVSGDVAIGVAATGSLAVGVIVTAMTRGFNIDVCNYMFGSILAMNRSDVALSLALSAAIIGLYALFFNRLFLITCDEDFARASGVNLTRYQFLIALLTALTIVVGMRMMGTLLISSLIIFPAVTARKLVSSFKALVVASAVVSVVCFVIGIVVSFLLNLPTGASIVAVNIVAMLAAAIAQRF